MKLPWDAGRLGVLLKRWQPALLVLAVGLLLLLWPTGSDDASERAAESGATAADWSEQTHALEAQLSAALSQIEGVGEATVVLTLDSGARQELAADETEGERTAVIISTGSGQEEAVRVQEFFPRYRGALIVCDGGGEARVKLRVLQAVQAVTGLSANQISICERTGGSQK